MKLKIIDIASQSSSANDLSIDDEMPSDAQLYFNEPKLCNTSCSEMTKLGTEIVLSGTDSSQQNRKKQWKNFVESNLRRDSGFQNNQRSQSR